MTIKAGIIGCGGIAKCHIAGYKSNNIEITAVTDINPDAAKAMGAELGAEVFASFRELIESGRVDLISICTPPVAHEADAVLALEHGVNVLLEKPSAANVEAARKIKAAADKSGARLMLAFRHRFIPAIVRMKEMIDSGCLGQVVFFQNTFCGPAFDMKDKWFSKKAVAGGGSMLDTSSHSVDLFRFLIGEVTKQHAVCHTHLEGTDVEDAAIIILKAENGVIGSLTSAWVAGTGKADIIIMGQDGKAEYNYGGDLTFHKRGAEKPEKIEIPELTGGFAEQIGSFIKAIESNQEPEITAFDGLRCLEIINACYKEN
ncbi:MAG: Gfo/Idh/MocA family oxidoreductase [Victivallales bacterium]